MAILKTHTNIKFKKNHPNAQLPSQGKEGDAAFDIRGVENFTLHPGETKAVATGLILADMPSNDELGNSLILEVETIADLAKKGIFVIGVILDES